MGIALAAEIAPDFGFVTNLTILQKISGLIKFCGLALGGTAKNHSDDKEQRRYSKTVVPREIKPLEKHPYSRERRYQRHQKRKKKI